MASSQPKSPAKEKVTCIGCGKQFQVLRSHLKRTEDRENPCKNNYDMQTLETEAERLHREQMAARNRELYHKDPEKKRETMAKYYQEHKEPPLRELECPACGKGFFYQKSIERHIIKEHCQAEKFSCDICEKEFDYYDSLSRHMKELHGGAKQHRCNLCPAAYTRAENLKRHKNIGEHFYEFECGLCKKNLVFKKFKHLIDHVKVRGMERRMTMEDGRLGRAELSLTCSSQESGIVMVEGTRVTNTTTKEIFESDKNGWKGKEKYINAGLSAAYDGAEQKGQVEVEFIYDKEHVTYGPRCVVCDEKEPFSSEYCKFKCTKNWHISWSDT